jgi:cell division protein FtsL
MKHRFATTLASLALAITLLFSASFVSAAPAAKKYQVTGKITELTDTTIVVQTTKGDERWEIERSADMKVEGELKVGAKVTIEYRMVAKSVEVKPEK